MIVRGGTFSGAHLRARPARRSALPHWLQLMLESLPSLLWAALMFTVPLTLLSRKLEKSGASVK